MNKSIGVIIFAIGAAVGCFVAWQYTKQKYETITQEEIASVKEAFLRKEQDNDKNRACAKQAMEKPSITEYSAVLRQHNYATDSDRELVIYEADPIEDPYTICPEAFGVFDNYDRISLTYYADGVLADEDDSPITNIETIVGVEALNSFGEYEDDSVFVRNERLRTDYEILLDQRNYSDVAGERPHEVEM